VTHLLDEVGCVAADLSGLRLPTQRVSVSPTAVRQAGGWRRASLALFGADAVMLDGTTVAALAGNTSWT